MKPMMTSNLKDGSEKPVNYLSKHLIVSLNKELTHGLSNDAIDMAIHSKEKRDYSWKGWHKLKQK